jgi:transposase
MDLEEVREFFRKCPDERETKAVFSGSRSGRPKRLSVEETDELRALAMHEPFSLRELADMFKVSRMTVWRVLYRYGTV